MVVIKAETSMVEEDSIMADRGHCGGRGSWNMVIVTIITSTGMEE